MGTPVALIALPIFGILTMGILLGVNRKTVSHSALGKAVLFFAVMVLLNVLVCQVFGLPVYRAAYFFLVQFPLFLLFRILTVYRGVKLLFVTLTTITLASLPVNINLAVSTLIVKSVPVTNTVLILACLLVLVLVYLFMKPDFNYILQYGESREFWKFCIIPVIYYVYGFGLTGYNFAKDFSAQGFFLRRLPDAMVFISYMLTVHIFRNTREKQLMKSEQALLTARLAATDERLAELHTTTAQAAAYRHDLRHHLSLLGSFAECGDMEKITAYLSAAQGELDAITPMNYCVNQTVNLILSAFDNKAKGKGVALWVDAQLPEALSIPDTELCAVLSNGLENALTAAAQLEDTALRTIRMTCSLNRENLLLMIENPYIGEVGMENGIPVSRQKEHGFGCRSMVAIAEKRKGHCVFKAEKGMFVLRVVLPV